MPLRLCTEAFEWMALIFLKLILAKPYGYKEALFTPCWSCLTFLKTMQGLYFWKCLTTCCSFSPRPSPGFPLHLQSNEWVPLLSIFLEGKFSLCLCTKELQNLTKMYLQKLAEHMEEQSWLYWTGPGWGWTTKLDRKIYRHEITCLWFRT